jgi:enterobacteria phage integrase
LATTLDATPRKHVTTLVTAYGKAFTGRGFENMVRAAIDAAGLPARCVAHGW